MRSKLMWLLLGLLAISFLAYAGYNRTVYEVPKQGGEWDFSLKPNQDLDVLLKASSGSGQFAITLTRMDNSKKEPLVKVNGEEFSPGQSTKFRLANELTIHIVNPGDGVTVEFNLQAKSK